MHRRVHTVSEANPDDGEIQNGDSEEENQEVGNGEEAVAYFQKEVYLVEQDFEDEVEDSYAECEEEVEEPEAECENVMSEPQKEFGNEAVGTEATIDEEIVEGLTQTYVGG